MSPDQAINALQTIGVSITRQTLLNYESQQLIDSPKRGGGGTGGFWTDYEMQHIVDAYVAYCLLHGDPVDKGLKTLLPGKGLRMNSGTVKIIRDYFKQATIKEDKVDISLPFEKSLVEKSFIRFAVFLYYQIREYGVGLYVNMLEEVKFK